MSATGGEGPGDEGPDLDLDRDLRAGGDAQVSALFREGLRPRGGEWLNLPAIERAAKQKHRRGQAVTSGVLAAAAVVAAVLVVVAPWSAHGRGQGIPAVPTPTVTQTDRPVPPARVTRSSLMQAGDLSLTPGQTGLSSGRRAFRRDGKAEDRTGMVPFDRFCGLPVFSNRAPGPAWSQAWESTEGHSPTDYRVTEEIRQWPGHPERASAEFTAIRKQQKKDQYCSQNPVRATAQEVGGDSHVTVTALVGQTGYIQHQERGQAVAVWNDMLITIDVLAPDAKTRSGAGESVGQIAVNLLGVAMNRLAGPTSDGRDRSSPQWSAPGLGTDAPIPTAVDQ